MCRDLLQKRIQEMRRESESFILENVKSTLKERVNFFAKFSIEQILQRSPIYPHVEDKVVEYYIGIYKNVAFENWDNFYKESEELKQIILSGFHEKKPFLKLVGSSATRTVRKGEEDFDYAVAFSTSIKNKKFLKIIESLNLNVTDINENKEYNYLKVSGEYKRKRFVLVPMIHPQYKIKKYEQDAFYHPDFINQNKLPEHAFNVILAKEFFSQIGVYERVKGISCEFMILYFKEFNSMLHYFANNDFLRINFSQNNLKYTDAPLVIDYPFLGGRSFTDKVTKEIYQKIQNFSRKVIEDYTIFNGGYN